MIQRSGVAARRAGEEKLSRTFSTIQLLASLDITAVGTGFITNDIDEQLPSCDVFNGFVASE